MKLELSSLVIICLYLSSLLRQVASSPLSFSSILYHHNGINPNTKQIWIKEVKIPDKDKDNTNANDNNTKDEPTAYENSLIDPVLRVTYKFVDFNKEPVIKVVLDEKAALVPNEDSEITSKQLC